jgi:hypothetical protein
VNSLELDINALQMLDEIEPEVGLYPCTWWTCWYVTCTLTTDDG